MSEEVKVETVSEQEQTQDVMASTVHNPNDPVVSAKTYGNIDLKIFRTKHLFSSKNNWNNCYYSVGVLIDDKVIFTSDSKCDPELIDWLCSEYKIEAIFHDCQFGQNAVHASYNELKETLTEDLKEITYLCHYSDGCETKDVTTDGFAGLVKRGVYYDL